MLESKANTTEIKTFITQQHNRMRPLVLRLAHALMFVVIKKTFAY